MKATSTLTLACAVLFVASCNRKDSLPLEPAPVTHPTPQEPSLALSADTAFYNDTGTVLIMTDAQKVQDEAGKLVIGTKLQIPHITKDTTITLTAINSNEYGSTEVKRSITIKVFSENSTRMDKYGWLAMVESKGCLAGTQNSSAAVWTSGPISCDTYRFYANKSGAIAWGECNGSPLAGTVNTNDKWKWANESETALDLGTPGSPYIVNVIFYSDGFATWHIDQQGYYDYERYKSM